MSLYNLLDNQIGYTLSNFEFEIASLQIDQLLQLNSSTQGNSNTFTQDYIKNWLSNIYLNIQKSSSFANQAGKEGHAQIKFGDEINKFEQSVNINDNSIYYTIAFPFDEEGIKPEECKYIRGIKKFSKSESISVNSIFQAPVNLGWNQGQLNDDDYFLIFPILFEGKNIYNTSKIEYINSISSLLAGLTRQNNNKKILLTYEFLENFDVENKRNFYRSFIRNFLTMKYRRYEMHLENISLLFDSSQDVKLFNYELSTILELLRYNSPLNIVDNINEFIANHPYIKDGSIEDDTISIQNIKNELPKKRIAKPTKKIIRNVENLQLDVKTDDPILLLELNKIHSVKDMKQCILLLGESGVGKTAYAKSIHRNSTDVNSKTKFVAINCAAIPSELIESELFGYDVGSHGTAFKKFEGKIKLADKGTLFLDEIGKAPLSVQAKLLTFIDEKSYYSLGSNDPKKADTRIIFATNEDPLYLIKQGRMLPDFYYRISQLKFTITPLRERPADLKKFIYYFKRLSEEDFNITLQLGDEVVEYMLKLKWPGNIRQVENTISQIYVECKATQLEEITKSLVEKYIEKIPTNNNFSTFTNFDNSFRSFFEYWKSIKSEFDIIQIQQRKVKTNDDSKAVKKNKINNSHSFLKLIIEPMAAHTYDLMNLEVNKSSKLLGLSLGDKKNYSPYYDRLSIYPKIKKVFEKLEN